MTFHLPFYYIICFPIMTICMYSPLPEAQASVITLETIQPLGHLEDWLRGIVMCPW